MSLNGLITPLLLLPFIFKHIKFKKNINLKQHIAPAIKFFIPTIAVTIYTMIDRTMIGFLVPGTVEVINNNVITTVKVADIENGNYEQAEKIIRLLLTVVTSLSAVLVPRNAFLFKNQKFGEIKSNLVKSVEYVYFIGIPMALGIVCISQSFSFWFYTAKYDKIPMLFYLLSPTIVLTGLTTLIGDQFFLVCNRENQYIISAFTGAIANVILNFILIPKLYSYGAALASVLSQLIILLVQIYFIKDVLKPREIISPIIKEFDAGLIMFLITFTISQHLDYTVLSTIITILIGMTIYFGLLIIFKEKNTMSVISKIKGYLKKVTKKEKV